MFKIHSKSFSSIFALSTPYGKSGISVFRISGSSSSHILRKLTKSQKLPKPRMATYLSFYCGETNQLIDKGMCLWFPQPNSFTGEDCVELHLHGSTAVIDMMSKVLSKDALCRLAQPGEFIKRRFLAGKASVREVEATRDLIASETEKQLILANQQLQVDSRDWSIEVGRIKEELISCKASIEAMIDFNEEDNVNSDNIGIVYRKVVEVDSSIQGMLRLAELRQKLRNGIKVCIVGQPNAGKSTLINVLSKQPVSITSNIPGTTRDVIKSFCNVSGYPVVFIDTAGLRNTGKGICEIEKEGIKKAYEAINQSQILILMIDVLNCYPKYPNCHDLSQYIHSHMLSLGIDVNNVENTNQKVLILFNKIDAIKKEDYEVLEESCGHLLSAENSACNSSSVLLVSLLQENYVNLIHENLSVYVSEMVKDCFNQNKLILASTQISALHECSKNLKAIFGLNLKEVDKNIEFFAHDLFLAIESMEKLTGKRIQHDEILNVLFKDFCIGK